MSQALPIMISSTRKDLMPYRVRASAVIEKLRADYYPKYAIAEISMERAVQTGKREYPVAVSKRWIDQAHFVVVIVGWYYGTVTDEEGADGLGVTEWEYLHARLKGKSTFVFLAGDDGTPDAYDPMGEKNIALIGLNLPADELSKLRDFRKSLTGSLATFFKNLDDFEKKLERTLRVAVDALPPDVLPNSALADLILEVEDPIRKCAESVKQLEIFKDIHDALHTIRQVVLKPIRDRVLSEWEAKGTLSLSNERLLNKFNLLGAELLQVIREKRKAFGEAPPESLALTLAALDAFRPLWSSPEDCEAPDRGVFTERMDNFADALQRAFFTANDAMQAQSSTFNELHGLLQRAISVARNARALGHEEAETLDEEVTKVRINASRLAKALADHDTWQGLHNELELANTSGAHRKRRLEQFFSLQRPNLPKLLDRLLGSTDRDAAPRLSDALEWLRDSTSGWRDPFDEDQIGRFLAAFDDCFFELDLATKAVVRDSSNRVDAFDKLLRSLRHARGSGTGKST